jgi:16S rRNA (guanine966-N2)-methyltransferase
MFMALEPLEGLRVVDLFSGSGALGIEALSRGAISVSFVESQDLARQALAANLADLGIESGTTIWPVRLPQGLKRVRRDLAAADLILLDPPYGGDLARATLDFLGGEGGLAPGVRIVVEHHGRDLLPRDTGRIERVRERRYGETVVSTYGVRADADGGAADSGGSR